LQVVSCKLQVTSYKFTALLLALVPGLELAPLVPTLPEFPELALIQVQELWVLGLSVQDLVQELQAARPA